MHAVTFLVSIPNGMEFYPIEQVSFTLGHTFQFPTGWNSTKRPLRWVQSCHCFNSQRDGILLGKISATRANYFCFNSQRDGILRSLKCSRIGELGRFQFPTGWNSTIGQKTRARKSIVSIPNGMEFYFLCDFGAFVLCDVSIPNGMEFYATVYPLCKKGTCFNSQQDGILLYKIIPKLLSKMFQFPTGWNSTCGCLRGYCFRCRFQFPTGWNSTLNKLGIAQ